MRARPERLFYHRLAAHLGGMTKNEMLHRMSSYEITEWVAVERLTGTLGPARADLHAGAIVAAITNANRKKGTPPLKPTKVFVWDREQQSPDEMWEIAQAMNEALGGTVREPITP